MPYVAFTGASSTGKTTLLNDCASPVAALAKQYNIDIVWHKERARMVYERDYAHRYDSFGDVLNDDPLGYQLKLAKEFAKDAAEVALNPKTLFIADRTGFDVAIYTCMLGGNGQRDADVIDEIFKTLHASLKIVDHIFLTSPITDSAEQDGHRPDHYNNPAVRALEVNMFKHMGVLYPNVTPLPKDREARVATFTGVISGLLAQEASWQL
jgi:predicted ATPase